MRIIGFWKRNNRPRLSRACLSSPCCDCTGWTGTQNTTMPKAQRRVTNGFVIFPYRAAENWWSDKRQKPRSPERVAEKRIFVMAQENHDQMQPDFPNKPREITCKLDFSVNALIELLRSSLTCQVCRLPSTCSVGFDFKSASHFTSSCFVSSFVQMHICISIYWNVLKQWNVGFLKNHLILEKNVSLGQR